MTRIHEISFEGNSYPAAHGEVLLDALLQAGADIPYQCRAGHCGTCCVRLVDGAAHGGAASEPGIVHACQCRIAGDMTIARRQQASVRTAEGVVTSLRSLSRDIVQVGIRTERPLPHHAGQYAQVQFRGYPARPFSMTYPLYGDAHGSCIWLHVRRNEHGRVTPALGRIIKPGHRVTVTGPYGAAYFRPNAAGRLILISAGTGFAPIWPIAVAALRENPQRMMLVVAGGRTVESLYMRPALAQLAKFPNVLTVPVCSREQTVPAGVYPGRPTDCIPRLLPTDVIYTCGAPDMVAHIKTIAAAFGVTCHADPFIQEAPTALVPRIEARPVPLLALPAPTSLRPPLLERLAASLRKPLAAGA